MSMSACMRVCVCVGVSDDNKQESSQDAVRIMTVTKTEAIYKKYVG